MKNKSFDLTRWRTKWKVDSRRGRNENGERNQANDQPVY